MVSKGASIRCEFCGAITTTKDKAHLRSCQRSYYFGQKALLEEMEEWVARGLRGKYR